MDLLYALYAQSCAIQDLPVGSTTQSILDSSLAPSQDYQVKVRSQVAPGSESSYGGIPSEWSLPVDWTSHGGEKCFGAANMAAYSERRHSCVELLCLSSFVVGCFYSLRCCWFPISHVAFTPHLCLHRHVRRCDLPCDVLHHSSLS